MSTSRRRPTAGRRPQVAGRPRNAAPAAENEASQAPESGEGRLAVEERTESPSPSERTRPVVGGRPRTVARPIAGTDTDDAETVDTGSTDTGSTDTGSTDTGSTDTRTVDTERTETPMVTEAAEGSALPAAPAVRSGESTSATSAARSGPLERLRRIPLPQAPVTRRGTAALLAVTILLTAAAVFFAVSWGRVQFSGTTANTALSDVGATATVSEQVGEAVTKVYSFDHARLDQAESDARAVITGPFTGQFDQIFGNVRQLAPKQQAVVTATIPKSAVQSIDGDRATVYVFVNQVVRRVDDAGRPQQGTAAARLRVDAVYLDGRWKVSGMTPA